jgi:hypothetical protein
MFRKQLVTSGEIDVLLLLCSWLPCPPSKAVQHGQYRINRGENVRFRTPKGRNSQNSQSKLQRT